MVPSEKKTIVVVPAYNEEKTIKEVIFRTKKYADIFIVNDGSKDETENILKSMGVPYLTHKKNTHIPQSIIDGMKYAIEKDYDYIITMDAGLSHLPEEIPIFLTKEHSDLVIGVRKDKKNVPFYRTLLTKTAKILINFALQPIGSKLSKPHFNDVTSGYRRYSNKAARLLINHEIKAKSFDIHTETLMIIYRNGLSILEVPITYVFSNSSLNKKVIFDSFKMFLDILFFNRK